MNNTQPNNPQPRHMKSVFTITERNGRSFWTRVGVGFVNNDGSLNLRLDAIPLNGNLQVREYEAAREGAGAADSAPVSRPRAQSRTDQPPMDSLL
jgi:hypothetical protein